MSRNYPSRGTSSSYRLISQHVKICVPSPRAVSYCRRSITKKPKTGIRCETTRQEGSMHLVSPNRAVPISSNVTRLHLQDSHPCRCTPSANIGHNCTNSQCRNDSTPRLSASEAEPRMLSQQDGALTHGSSHPSINGYFTEWTILAVSVEGHENSQSRRACSSTLFSPNNPD